MKEESGNDVAVTVRLYGPNTDIVINRQRELQVRIDFYEYFTGEFLLFNLNFI